MTFALQSLNWKLPSAWSLRQRVSETWSGAHSDWIRRLVDGALVSSRGGMGKHWKERKLLQMLSVPPPQVWGLWVTCLHGHIQETCCVDTCDCSHGQELRKWIEKKGSSWIRVLEGNDVWAREGRIFLNRRVRFPLPPPSDFNLQEG